MNDRKSLLPMLKVTGEEAYVRLDSDYPISFKW